MGKSKRKKASGNDVIALQSVASQRQQKQQQQQLPKAPERAETPTISTPGRGEAKSPRPQQLAGKSRHGAAVNNIASTHHLPTITRGPEALRQMRHHNNSPVQQTPANQAVVARIEHLSEIAKWAATNKISSLGAFYGERLASACQSAGIPSPVLNSQCQRCETVLLPGVNCSSGVVAPKKRKKKWRKGKAVEAISSVQTTVVHRCHYCKYGNRKAGTHRDDVKTKLAEAAARAQQKLAASSSSSSNVPLAAVDPLTPAHCEGVMKALSAPVTPAGSQQTAVLTPASAFRVVDQADNSSSRKRKRKGWTGLKAMSTSIQSRELPTPERLAFAVDFSSSPLNPTKKSSV